MKQALTILAALALSASAHAQLTITPEGVPGPKPPESPEFRTDRDDYAQTLAAYQSGDTAQALKLADDLIATYPSGPWVERAMLLKARAAYRAHDLAGCEKQLDALAKRFPASSVSGEAADLRMAIAAERLGAGKAAGAKSLEKMVETNPYGPRSDEAQFEIGKFYLDKKQYVDASEAFSLILAHYPDSRYREDAMFLQAKATFLQNSGPNRDGLPYEMAGQELQDYLKEFPNGKHAKEAEFLIKRAENALAEKLFLTGEFYRREKQTRAAERYYAAALTKYPKTSWAKRSREHMPIGWEPPVKPEAPAADATEKPEQPPAEEPPPPERTAPESPDALSTEKPDATR